MLDIKTVEDAKQYILNGTIGMYERTGEMVTYIIIDMMKEKFDSNLIDTAFSELQTENKIKLVTNPYKVGDDFFGLADKEYPNNCQELMLLRQNRK